ncbi:hypothetical protein SAMN05216223_109289 [Actinacidiphila yanglinensis]|uniref:Polymerase nucleotidyl transferase domain-containing protein n=1 Tax=Actinacidiphila yanglinensis TaxID=310779 RepID=A0A1H6CPD4_9ACTN|nr:nucleotidyltransferase domain-containing protein [Actinacidiphila yanglinensis]SEG74831.1 hypothetical protein SAMN05216223_109289 [Actinacidiphila yanglinensis]
MTAVPGLDPVVRAALAGHVMEVLARACPGSGTDLRGSLARGTADPYSDIDIAWTVPDDRFGGCVDRAGEVLARVRPVMSLRGDPESAETPGHRLLFVAFEGLPPFWRLDLDVRAEPGAAPSAPAVRHPWRPAASALANGVAAVKALHRGDPATAHALLTRAYPRVGLPPHPSGHFPADLATLAEAATALDSSLASQAAALTALPLP